MSLLCRIIHHMVNNYSGIQVVTLDSSKKEGTSARKVKSFLPPANVQEVQNSFQLEDQCPQKYIYNSLKS